MTLYLIWLRNQQSGANFTDLKRTNELHQPLKIINLIPKSYHLLDPADDDRDRKHTGTTSLYQLLMNFQVISEENDNFLLHTYSTQNHTQGRPSLFCSPQKILMKVSGEFSDTIVPHKRKFSLVSGVSNISGPIDMGLQCVNYTALNEVSLLSCCF